MAAAGRPIRSSTATYGLFATLASFHGSSVTTTAIDPMLNTRARHTTERTAVRTAALGSSDSAAAIVAISAPKNEKTTTSRAAKTGELPLGRNPP